MARVRSSIVGFIRSSSSSRSLRRREAHGANGSLSNCARPCSLHSFFFRRWPSFIARACSWFIIRVRICTMRCRCHSSCRRSRFSGLGTQIRGKLSSNSSFNRSRASLESVFCLRTRLVLISAASPIHSSIPNSANNRSNQREYPVASIPSRSGLQITIELLCLSLPVVQSPFTTLSCLGVSKRDVLVARVLIHAYNQHVRLLSPEPMVVDKP